MIPWKTLETVATDEGALQLRQRGEREFLITIDGRVLMTSTDRRSELGLATLACKDLTNSPRVLIGGLGMAYTVRAALDALPPTAEVIVVELTPVVAEWCKGPLAVLTNGALRDRRVKVVIDDVSRVIARAPRGHYDAIILDLYEGPHAATQRADDPFYGSAALMRSRTALAPDGVLAVWSEDPDPAFKRRFEHGFDVATHRIGKARKHIVYLGRRRPDAPSPDERRARRPGPPGPRPTGRSSGPRPAGRSSSPRPAGRPAGGKRPARGR